MSRLKGAARSAELPPARWIEIIDEARELGLEELIVSGGEPILYRGLERLIDHARRQGLSVVLNTNGIAIDEGVVDTLTAAGLGRVMVSLYSSRATVHDTLKGVSGAWDKAVEAISSFRARGVTVTVNTVLTAPGLAHLDGLLRLCSNHGVDDVLLAYLEGDDEQWRPTVDDVRHFLDVVLPRCERVIEETYGRRADWRWHLRHVRGLRRLVGGSALSVAQVLAVLRSLFGPERRLEDYVSGRYHSRDYAGCGRVGSSLLIIVNGDVLPCFGAQYTGKASFGHVDDGLRRLLSSPRWLQMERSGTGFCHRCPVPCHQTLPLRLDDRPWQRPSVS